MINDRLDFPLNGFFNLYNQFNGRLTHSIIIKFDNFYLYYLFAFQMFLITGEMIKHMNQIFFKFFFAFSLKSMLIHGHLCFFHVKTIIMWTRYNSNK